MKLLVVFCYALLSASFPLVGQKGMDPISGHWGSDGTTFLELKFDGKRAVTGTTIWRAGSAPERRSPIKAGTFDRKTGALKIEGEGETPDGKTAKYVIEGKLDKETLSGTYRFGDQTGTFSFTKL